MLKRVFLSAFASFALLSQDARAESAESQRATLPEAHQTVIGAEGLRLDLTFRHVLLRAIEEWLATNFDLPANVAPPQIKFAPPAAISHLRYKGVLTYRPQEAVNLDRALPSKSVVAVYDDANRTIYLPENWTGNTPAELSVLVHELVHHLQNIGQAKFECPQERERLAYKAQEAWLRMFGRDIESEFELDGFTLLVKTSCIF